MKQSVEIFSTAFLTSTFINYDNALSASDIKLRKIHILFEDSPFIEFVDRTAGHSKKIIVKNHFYGMDHKNQKNQKNNKSVDQSPYLINVNLLINLGKIIEHAKCWSMATSSVKAVLLTSLAFIQTLATTDSLDTTVEDSLMLILEWALNIVPGGYVPVLGDGIVITTMSKTLIQLEHLLIHSFNSLRSAFYEHNDTKTLKIDSAKLVTIPPIYDHHFIVRNSFDFHNVDLPLNTKKFLFVNNLCSHYNRQDLYMIETSDTYVSLCKDGFAVVYYEVSRLLNIYLDDVFLVSVTFRGLIFDDVVLSLCHNYCMQKGIKLNLRMTCLKRVSISELSATFNVYLYRHKFSFVNAFSDLIIVNS